MFVLAFLAKRNTAIFVSGFPMDIYYAHGIINPTDTGLKRVQNTQCRIVCMYFFSVFFPIFSGCLSFLNNLSSSVILLDFEDVECDKVTVCTFRSKQKERGWFQCMKGLTNESWLAFILQRNVFHPLTIFSFIYSMNRRGTRAVAFSTALNLSYP